MKTIRIEEEADLKLKKLAKEFRMSKKSMVNMILENLVAVDVEMFQKRDRGGIPNIIMKNDEGEDDVIEFEDTDEEDFEIEIDEEDEEDYEVEGFSPAEIQRKQLKLAAIKANIISEEDIGEYVDENYRD
ncbi:hypothetical protein LCGC14_2032950 [marine sediment metagenome]|uniref:Uncharacterized protein n=1 Tax=marine sediment metagenome TaxID=412755 RepID=A0A0F9HR30_9ZZZZ